MTAPLRAALDITVAADLLAAMPPRIRQALRSSWEAFARTEQREPALPWRTWLYVAGRGAGKSRTGAETVRKWALANPGAHIALVAPTAADARDVMARSLLTSWRGGVLDASQVPLYEPSKRSLTWANGSRATTYSADEPDRLRGPEHNFAWADELCAFNYAEEAWNMLQFGLRLGDGSRCVATTTPRPTPFLRKLMDLPTTRLTRGSTLDNVENLDESAVAEMRTRYEGTRIGRQEIYGELLEDVVGAIFKVDDLDRGRVAKVHAHDLVRVVVGVDPSGGSNPENDEQGIVVVGLGADGHAYVLEDASCKLTPDGWGARAVECYARHSADRILVERNYGGAMASAVLESAAQRRGIYACISEVTASRGKHVRAEPISALLEQGRIHMVGSHPQLESQMTTFVPGAKGSAGMHFDRMDAFVWACTELLVEGQAPPEWEPQTIARRDTPGDIGRCVVFG